MVTPQHTDVAFLEQVPGMQIGRCRLGRQQCQIEFRPPFQALLHLRLVDLMDRDADPRRCAAAARQ